MRDELGHSWVAVARIAIYREDIEAAVESGAERMWATALGEDDLAEPVVVECQRCRIRWEDAEVVAERMVFDLRYGWVEHPSGERELRYLRDQSCPGAPARIGTL